MRRLEDFPDADLRIFDRPALPDPQAIDSVYLVGICGKGMGALAELLHANGYQVRGSDEAAYPPMSTRLAALGIPIDEGYSADNLRRAKPDLTIIGNACIPTHPEATCAREKGLVQASFPEALAHLVLRERKPIVIAGTHGKTTTTGLTAHVLREAKHDPGFLVGGVIAGLDKTAELGTGEAFVIEGDEYDSAYFDKRPKMLLYRPEVAVVTSMEFDHADIYTNWEEYQEAFHEFAALLPEEGLLILHGDDPAVAALRTSTRARVLTYGLDVSNDVFASDAREAEGGQSFRIHTPDHPAFEVTLPLGGAHNRLNALATIAVALNEGISSEAIVRGLASFKGMKRRQEVKGEWKGILVVDDFAHHPTAVAATLEAVRERWHTRFENGGRLLAAFEPRSNSSRRKLFESRYAESFAPADRLYLSTPPLRHNDSPDDFMDPAVVASQVEKTGTSAAVYPNASALLPDLVANARPGDLVLIMSNGSFDGLLDKLIGELRRRSEASAEIV